MEEFLKRVKFVKIKDLLSGFLFVLAIIPAFILKIFCKKKIWLICEYENEARDNAYVFFKYVSQLNDEKILPIYAINKKSPDYEKVKDVGKVIKYGSYIHWIYYLAAEFNISSQKGGKPNAAVCYVLEVYGILKNKRVFLQHGVTQNESKWIHYKNTKMRLFICSARPEYEFVKEKFGYPEGYVKLLGLPRFDELHNVNVKKNQILIMPTWRIWLDRKTDAYYKFNCDGVFENSEYYKQWNGLLNNEKLKEFIEKENLEVIFYPHRHMQKYVDSFSTNSERIKVASWKEYDIQKLLKESALMITDFSSVAFDFAYMRKPVLYYIFDIDKFREGHLSEGYYDYVNEPLGISTTSEDVIVEQIIKSFSNNFEVDKNIQKRVDNFFELYDDKNCERIYNEIKKIK